MNEKDNIRQQMKAARKSLTHDEISDMSMRITRHVSQLDEFLKAKHICVFMSAFNEPRTQGIIDLAISSGKQICAPAVDEKTKTMKLFTLTPTLIKGAYSISEPERKYPVLFSEPDFIFVPGLAFDKRGNRLGFGMGYYDKLLSQSNAYFAGLCYDFQLVDSIPHEVHDVKMHKIITETGIY